MRALFILFAILLPSCPASANCYDLPATRGLTPYAAGAIIRQVTVAIDQTTFFPDDVRKHVIEQVARLATPGTEIAIASFSSYTGVRFPKIEATVSFEIGLPAAVVHSVSRRARDVLNICLDMRRRQGITLLRNALTEQFQAARPTIGQSDIMNAIQQFGEHIRSSGAKEKLFLIVTDALENSSSTSFYKAKRPRLIDPEMELANAADRHLFANLGGARVYIVGLALVPIQGDSSMPSEIVRRLELFWEGYLRRSNVASVRIGKPLLLEDIR